MTRRAVRWGLLSTAAIHDRVLPQLRGSPDVAVVAVAGRDPVRTSEWARERGIASAHGSYEALLADPDVEAVYNALPNSLHAEWTTRALAAGKHVLCEKPFSRHPGDVQRVFSFARSAGLVVMEALMYRHNPQTHTLCDLVTNGAIGRVSVIRSSFRFAIASARDVRLSAELEGGSLMDLGAYCVHTSRLLAGEPVHVYGERDLGPSGVDVRFAGTLSFEHGAIAQFDTALTLPAAASIEVAGERASIVIEDPWLCRRPGIELRREDGVERVPVDAAGSYRLQFENFSAAVRGDAPPLLGFDDALGQARTLAALHRSAAEQRPVGV